VLARRSRTGRFLSAYFDFPTPMSLSPRSTLSANKYNPMDGDVLFTQ
jgi:hypothetical protein